MAKIKKPAVPLVRLEARTHLILAASRLALFAFCLAIGFVVISSTYPQRRELKRLQQELANQEAKRDEVRADRERHAIELRALREDPAYLEVRARDRLGLHLKGERVLRFPRNE
jgi:cell division protein FtsB